MSELGLVKRQVGHRARLALSPSEIRVMDDQAHAARTLWNCLHSWWQMMPKNKRTLAGADAAIRQARKDLDYLAVLPAQAAQAVLKTYHRAWMNCWEGRAQEPNYKGRFRSPMSVDIPQGRDLNIVRVHRRWGMVNIPKVGRVRFRWTKDLPVGKRADKENRITGARLVKDALGWHIAFRIQTLECAPEPHQGAQVGIDAGVNIPLALSNKDHQDHRRPPRLPNGDSDRDKWLTPKEKAKLLKLERQAAHRKTFPKRGEKTSKRLQQTYDQIMQLRAKATRRALDWQHQTTTYLARTYGMLVVEQLNILGMTRSPAPQARPRTAGRVPVQRGQGEGRTQPLHRPGGMGPDRDDAGGQDRPQRRPARQGPRPTHLPAMLSLRLHHPRQQREPGTVRMQEPRLRLDGERRLERSEEHLAPVPDRPRHRGGPGRRRARSQGG